MRFFLAHEAPQFVHLALGNMQGVEQIGGVSPTMAPGSIQPVTDGIRIDIDDTPSTPAEHSLLPRPASRGCHAAPSRAHCSTPCPGAPKMCPYTWCTAVEECHDRLHNGTDARRSRVGRHACIAGEDSSMW